MPTGWSTSSERLFNRTCVRSPAKEDRRVKQPWQSLRRVGLLGIGVLVRTFLSFSLEIELEGVVPWRAAALRLRHTGTAGSEGSEES